MTNSVPSLILRESTWLYGLRPIAEIRKRRAAYATPHVRFHFLLERSLPSDDKVSKAKALNEIHIRLYQSLRGKKHLKMSSFCFNECFLTKETVAEIIRAQIDDKAGDKFFKM